jgi:hypothetical protein
MGVFDQIHYNGEVYQTKDFDCQMDNYYLEGGKLLKAVGYTEDRSPATAWEKEHPGEELPEELQGPAGFCGLLTFIETGRELFPYTGEVEFYGDAGEYSADFREGVLVSITQVL